MENNSSVILLTDTHFGVKNDSVVFLKQCFDYFDTNLFPLIERTGIKTIIHLGDMFHSRKEINTRTFHWVKKRFLTKLGELGVTLYVLSGNHDLYYTKESSVTTLEVLEEFPFVKVIKENTVLSIADHKYTLVPWISNEDEYKSFIDFQTANSTDVCFGHFEMQNFEMNVSGYIQKTGINPAIFVNYKKVFSGHFHSKQIRDNIYYIGAPYEMDWSDFDKDKGIYTYDFSKDKLEFIKNTDKLYHKIYYKESEIEDLLPTLSKYAGKIVKIYPVENNNPTIMQRFIAELEKNNPEKFILIDAMTVVDVGEFDENKSVIGIIDDYLKEIKHPNEKVLNKILFKLYEDVIVSENQ